MRMMVCCRVLAVTALWVKIVGTASGFNWAFLPKKPWISCDFFTHITKETILCKMIAALFTGPHVKSPLWTWWSQACRFILWVAMQESGGIFVVFFGREAWFSQLWAVHSLIAKHSQVLKLQLWCCQKFQKLKKQLRSGLTLSRPYGPWGPVKYDVIFHMPYFAFTWLLDCHNTFKLYNFGQNTLCNV